MSRGIFTERRNATTAAEDLTMLPMLATLLGLTMLVSSLMSAMLSGFTMLISSLSSLHDSQVPPPMLSSVDFA